MVNQTQVLQGKEDLLVNLFDSEMNVEKISTSHDVSVTSFFDKVKALRLDRSLEFKKKLEERKDEVIELLESGLPVKKAAEILGVHPSTLLRIRKAWRIYSEQFAFCKKNQRTIKGNKEASLKPAGSIRFSCLDHFINEIVEDLESGATKADVAKKYKVSIQTIFNKRDLPSLICGKKERLEKCIKYQ